MASIAEKRFSRSGGSPSLLPSNGGDVGMSGAQRAIAGGTGGAWRAVLSGLCASLVGIGLARFAYTPLIPALVESGWFSPAAAAYLGAANLAGYLAGALLGRRLARRASAASLLRGMMLVSAASFFACAQPLPFAWFFVWRFAAGLAGGVIMVVAAPAVLAQVAPARRGLAGGAIFTGVGLGIAGSGTLVPLLMRLGLTETWLGLGAVALALTLLAWRGWPSRTLAGPAGAEAAVVPRGGFGFALIALFLAYGFDAVGVVPHMVFLVDFVARGLGQGLDSGAWYWVLFGLGATSGPLLAGLLADRIGFGPALRVAFLVQAGFVGLLALADGWVALVLSSLVIGAFAPGIVPLLLGRVLELAARRPGTDAAAAWSLATVGFALGQAAGAYGYSYLFAQSGSYGLLFLLGAGALLLAFAIELAAGRHRTGAA